MRRGIVCGSPGILPSSTGLQPCASAYHPSLSCLATVAHCCLAWRSRCRLSLEQRCGLPGSSARASCVAVHCGSAKGIRQYCMPQRAGGFRWQKQCLRSSRGRWRPRHRPRLDEPASASALSIYLSQCASRLIVIDRRYLP